MDKVFAFAHPGKIGDALYCLPTIRIICRQHEAQADFFTSEACRSAERLFKYQPYIRDFIIPKEYTIRDYGQGVQPWEMPVPSVYERVYQLGFQQFPQGQLHRFIARSAGVQSVPDPSYYFPPMPEEQALEPYIVVAYNDARGFPDMRDGYAYMIANCPVKVVQTGLPQDFVDAPSVDATGIDLLDVLTLLSRAELFVGFYSSILALANGFPDLPRVATLSSVNCGEQHGLHIRETYDLLFHPPSANVHPSRFAIELSELVNKLLSRGK